MSLTQKPRKRLEKPEAWDHYKQKNSLQFTVMDS